MVLFFFLLGVGNVEADGHQGQEQGGKSTNPPDLLLRVPSPCNAHSMPNKSPPASVSENSHQPERELNQPCRSNDMQSTVNSHPFPPPRPKLLQVLPVGVLSHPARRPTYHDDLPSEWSQFCVSCVRFPMNSLWFSLH